MTTQEYNRDVKRLLKKWLEYKDERDIDSYLRLKEKELKPEFMRLYQADKEFIFAKAESIRILLRMNLDLRFVPLHMFGVWIEERTIYSNIG